MYDMLICMGSWCIIETQVIDPNLITFMKGRKEKCSNKDLIVKQVSEEPE